MAINWPWQKAEHRSGLNYTEQRLADSYAAATDLSTADALAAAEQAVGLVGRAFASATVEGDRYGAVTASCLELIGRQAINCGESLHVIEVSGSRARLIPASYWYILGSDHPASWSYILSLQGPTAMRSLRLPSAAVIHPRHNIAPAFPWRGRSALSIAHLTATTAVKSEQAAIGEMDFTPTRLLPVPGTDKQIAQLRTVLPGGGVVATQSAVASAHIAGQEPSSRWAAQPIHPDPTVGHVSMRSEAAQEVLAALGVPPSLVMPNSDGTAQRESFRRFLHSTIHPLAMIVQEELREKLDSPQLTLNFQKLFAADLSARARAFQSMVGGGMDITKAAGISGIMELEGTD